MNIICFNEIQIKYEKLTLPLKKDFRTAHSSTLSRTNFLITTRHNKNKYLFGLGEAGLPPKKPNCYLADINDCIQFMKQLQNVLNTQIEKKSNIWQLKDHFEIFQKSIYYDLFSHILNIAALIEKPRFRSAKCALQFAIFDLWSKLQQKSLRYCIFGKQIQKSQFYSYYTISLDEDAQNMVEQAKVAVEYSQYIKIKLDNRIQLSKKVILKLNQQNLGKKWVIDANSSWSVQTALDFLEFIKDSQLSNKIYCIQQPFEIQPNISDWTQVRHKYNQEGIKIIADESFSILQDLNLLQPIIDGVNIKLQKIGGLISALKAIYQIKAKNKLIWIGSMICSQLACTQAFQLVRFADFGDIDGGLLTISPFKGGFEWIKKQGRLLGIEGNGLAVEYIC